MEKGRYVDDIFGGADSISKAQELVSQVNQLCMAGGFPLRKWISNETSILKAIPTTDLLDVSKVIIDDHIVIQSLGIAWCPTTDDFHFHTNTTSVEVVSKRFILSTIAKIFDPLGFLSPITITAKLLMQEIWTTKVQWDDPLPPNLITRWTDFIDSSRDLPNLLFPRWLGIESTSSIEIHGFCDASPKAMAAVVFCRTTKLDGQFQVRFVCAKTKVAPLKRLTIPRLELSAAVLLTGLVKQVLRVVQRENLKVYLWTDSSITFTWITKHPSNWKEFVHNRVCLIQDTLPRAFWNFVPGAENPADLATRGVTPSELIRRKDWWYGPSWLSKPQQYWPSIRPEEVKGDLLEGRPIRISTVNVKPSHAWELLNKYSSLNKLLNVTATCQRAIRRFKRVPNSFPKNYITPLELNRAKIFWIKEVQLEAFSQELKTLAQGKPLHRSSPLLRLNPYIDSLGLLRVGGRLQASNLSDDAKHPAILPKTSVFTTLIISDAHLRSLHGGTQITSSFIREEFWIIGGRAPVRSFILRCVTCARYRQKRAQQLMGQLPSERVIPSRPFLNSGVDYAGPLLLKTWKGKNARTYKAYVALFVCLSTSAVHLELVTDYTADAFMAAYKRFSGRRGVCATLISDCGTNLKGADTELQRLHGEASQESQRMKSLLAKDGTLWKYNPPSAPHFGGKWEAGVKSMKYHLKRVIGDTLLTYEELSILLTQIEAVLNSRPLCPLTEDIEDLAPLTPGHFIMGCAPTILPEPSLLDVKTSRLSRWQLLRQMLDSIWLRWSKEYLQRHHSIYKWNKPETPVKKGAIVLLIDERYPPAKWPLGRITQIHPGPDGLVRVVTVKTQTSEVKRPITKLCPLPVDQILSHSFIN